MVEVNGTYKHGRYDKIWLDSLHVMSNVKKCCHKRRPTGRIRLTTQIHRIKFHPDQMKSEGENEANRFRFALTLWPQAKSRSMIVVWNGMVEVMVPINMAGMNKFGWIVSVRCPMLNLLLHKLASKLDKQNSLRNSIWYSYGSKSLVFYPVSMLADHLT